MALTPGSPPHAGLHDIFYHILPHLTPDPLRGLSGQVSFEEILESVSAHNALACLARSHSMFTRPALATMWRSLPSQEPLEHLLCVVGIARRPHKPSQAWDNLPLELCGTLETHGSGWLRFQQYASLVQEVIVDPFLSPEHFRYAPPLEDTFWHRLASAFQVGDTPILPRLEVATIRSSNPPMDSGALRLLNPLSIRELCVAFPCTSKQKLKRLEKTPLKNCILSMQNVEVLSLAIDEGVSDEDTFLLDMESLPRIYPRLRILRLDHFRVTSLELNRLRPLAALPGLTELTVKLRCWEPVNWSIKLQALRNLTVSCGPFRHIDILLAHIDAPQLQTLCVSEAHANTRNMAQELPTHLHTLATKCPALTAFKWRSSYVGMYKMGYAGGQRIAVPLAELVAPLLTLRAMRHFSVSFTGSIVPYTPADLHAFAEAWPDLETFYFYDSNSRSPEPGEDPERYTDVEAVAAFARRCPRLRSMSIPIVWLDPSFKFDFTAGNESESAAARPSRASHAPALQRHWLRELSVDDLHVSRPRKRNMEDYKADVGWFRALMKEVCPSAAVRIQTESWIHGVLAPADSQSPPPANGNN